MLYNINKLEPIDIYHFMTQTVIPRPIAWIVTEDDGVINIAPFSFFTPLSSNPATLLVSIGYKDKEKKIIKDTLVNIKKTDRCTICVVDEHHLEKMHFSSKIVPKEQSEAELFNIKTKNILEDFPPMIEDSSVAYFCSFNQTIDLGENSTIPTIVNVDHIFADDSKIISKNEKQVIEFDPVARIGREYAYLGQKIPAPKIP
jgi:flavin reductase (DIM6/NTAB) family NADH-FMN oxidoreductase RutF